MWAFRPELEFSARTQAGSLVRESVESLALGNAGLLLFGKAVLFEGTTPPLATEARMGHP